MGSRSAGSPFPGMRGRIRPCCRAGKGRRGAKKTGPLSFKSTWKIDLPANVKRAAVADITGDGKMRLLTLAEDGTLTVHRIADGKPEKETSIAMGKGAAGFVVGRFTKGKPAIIVSPGGTFYWDSGQLHKKPAPEAEGAFASLRLNDGSEVFFVFAQGAPPTTYLIDLSAEMIYKPGPELPQIQAEGSSIREIVPEFPGEFFVGQPFPEEVQKGSIARVFDPRGTNMLSGVFAWQATDGSYVAVLDGSSLFPEPKADAKPTWKNPKLAGKVLDIALGSDIKGAKQTGFYVLQELRSRQKGPYPGILRPGLVRSNRDYCKSLRKIVRPIPNVPMCSP